MTVWGRLRIATTLLSVAGLTVSTVVSHLEQTASLPSTLVGRDLAWWTSSRQWGGLSAEFLLAGWFLLAGRVPPAPIASVEVLRFWSAIAVIGVCAGLLYLVGPRCLPLWLAIAGAGAIAFRSRRVSGTADLASIRPDWHALRETGALRRTVMIVAVACFVGQYLVLTGGQTTIAERDAQLARWFEAQPRTASAELTRPGKVRIVAFTDYECPACSFQIPALERTALPYTDDPEAHFEWEVRDFPLNASCNPAVSTRLHAVACVAAVAGRVAAANLDEAGTRAFRERLYARRGRLSEADVMAELDSAGLTSRFRERYDDEMAAVRRDAEIGRQLGVTSTPALFIDGRRIRDAQPRTLAAILTHETVKLGARLK